MTDEGRDRMTRAHRDATLSAKPRVSWPTPNTPSGGGNLMATPKHTGGIDLEGAAELWQTPAVDSFRSRGGDRKDEMGLDQQARIAWVTPASRDWKGANSETHVTETVGGRRHMDQLSNQVEHSFRPAQQTEMHGETSSQPAPTSRRRLNPLFVEWLMGLPDGWTSPEPINSEDLETWSSVSRARLRYLFCSAGRGSETPPPSHSQG